MSTSQALEASTGVAMVAERYRRGMTVAICVVIGTWHVGTDGLSALAGWHRFVPSYVNLLAWALLAVIGLVAGLWCLRPRWGAGGVGMPWLLAGALLTTEAAFYSACPRIERFHGTNWMLGAVGWFAIAVFWHRRPVELLGFLCLHGVLAARAMVTGPGVSRTEIAQFIMIQYGTCALQLAFAFGYRATARAARWAVLATERTTAVTSRRITALAVHEQRLRRYASIRCGARQTLAGLADGSLDPGDPQVRRTCGRYAARLRRLIAETDDVAEPLLHELRACSDVAELRGVQVEILTAGRLPAVPARRRASLTEPLIGVLSAARTTARITVTALPDGVAVAIVADCEQAAAAAIDTEAAEVATGPAVEANDSDDAAGAGDADPVAVTYFREGDLLWAESRWYDRSGSPSSTTTR